MAHAATARCAGNHGCGCATSPSGSGPVERAAWVRCIQVAVDDSGIAEPYRTQLLVRLQRAATGLVNTGY